MAMNAPAASTDNPGRMPATWAILAVLTAVSFFNYLDRMALSVLVVQIKRDLVLSDTQIGLVTGLGFALFYAIMGLPVARIAERGDKATVLSACVALWSLATAFSGAATSFVTLLLARSAVGVGEAGCVPASFAIIAQRFSIDRRPFAISVFQSGLLMGSGVGMIGAGAIGEWLGWRMTLAVIGLSGLPIAVLVAVMLRGVSPKSPAAASQTAIGDLRILFSRPAFNHLIAAMSIATFATYSLLQWLPTLLVRTFGVSLSKAGLVMGISMGVGGMIGILSGGVLAGKLTRKDRRWDLWLCSIVYAVVAVLFTLSVASSSITSAGMLIFISIMIMFVANGAGLAAVQRFAEPERRATANAVLVIATAIFGVGLGPVFVGFGSDHLQAYFGAESLRWTLAISCLTFLWSGAHFLMAARQDSADVDT
jgi:predicted MFS family arabinose efflux permease